MHKRAWLTVIGLTWLAVTAAVGSGNAASPAECTQLVINGGFEAGSSGWLQASAGGYDLISDFNPHSGDWGAYLAGQDNADDWLSQQIGLPALAPNGPGASSADAITLHAWWAIASEETDGAFDRLTISLLRPDGSLLADLLTIDNSADTGVWDEAAVDLAAYAGQAVVLRLAARTDGSNPTDFYVDDISIEACSTPGSTATATPSPSPSPAATPSATVTPTPTATASAPASPTATTTPTATPSAGSHSIYLPMLRKAES